MSFIGKVLVGVGAFGTAVCGGYTVGMSQQQLKRAGPNTQQPAAVSAAHPTCGHEGGCAFNRLAGVYDDIVDWEETGMLIGLMRWWLLRQAEGSVLELSAGTGRNLQHYRYKNITHLTLTDVSTSMLQEAQRKYFDKLQLQYKQPDLTCRFLLTDAQHMVAAPGQQPHTELLPPVPPSRPSSSRGSSSSGSGSGGSSSQAASPSRSMWRFKQPGSSSSDAGSSSSSDADNRSTTTSSSAPAPNLQADSLPAAGSTNSSASKASWRWSKQPHDASQKQPPSSATTSSSTSSSSSSSRSSSQGNTGGQTPGSTFAPHSFDTIVDTFGLCSCDDPVAVLRQAAQLLKPGGKLLLLEHGRGTWDFVNTAIDNQAEQHHQTYGCWYNRDILGIVQDAGLQVDSLSRWHFGTTSVIVASPAAAAAAPQQPAAAAQQAAQAA